MKTLFLGILLFLSISVNAQIPDSLLNEETKSLYKFINEWWRTPYRYGGSSKRGIDCSAFTQSLYKKVYDVNIPRVASQQYKVGKTITKEEVNTGDLVFFRSSGPSGWHVGVYLIDGWFLHSGTSNGVYVNNLSEEKYSKKIRGFKRVM
jgi:cell wall-associated NlpC family hydrolase